MSGMYMSEWPMFGTKDPNLGSSTDLLFDRDFIFGAFATCLIQGGYPVGATFERTGDILRDGVTFAQDEPVVQGGKYHHNGKLTEYVIDEGSWTFNSGATKVGDTVTLPTGSSITIGNASASGVEDANIYAYIEVSDFVGVACTFRTYDGVTVNNVQITGDGVFDISATLGAAADRNQTFIRNDSGTTATLTLLSVSNVDSRYDITPIYIPRSASPVSIDTAASQPNPDKHGLNWEFSDPKNGWAWDLLDGGEGTTIFTPLNFMTEWNPVSAGTTITSPTTFTTSGVGGAVSNIELTLAQRYSLGFGCITTSGSCEAWTTGTFGRILIGPEGITRFTPTNPDSLNLYLRVTEAGNTEITDFKLSELLPATGTLNLKGMSVVPSVTEWQTTGDFNILSGATGNQIIYIEIATGLICATDGTNITKSVQPYAAGQNHTVSLAFGDSKMQIYVDGVNGTQVPFVGTFTPGETLKWGLNNEDIFSKGNVCGQTTSSFSESVHLAEELAYDL